MLGAWVAFPAVQAVIWLGCGRAVAVLAGRTVPGPLLLPVGFCAVVVLAGCTAAVPGLARLTTPVVVAVAVAGLALGGRLSPRAGARWPAAAALAVLAVYAAPIVLSGTATFAGYIKLDDTATWMAFTDRVITHGRDLSGLELSSYLRTLQENVGKGYPIGAFLPLGIGRELTGIDVAWVIQPYMALLASLLALSLWELSGALVRSAPLRFAATVIASQPALLYGYYLWGGIKELGAAAVIALAAAVGPSALAGAGLRRLLPLALACAALVGCLSAPGLLWVAPVLLALLVAATKRDRAGAARRAIVIAAFVGVLVAPVLLSGGALQPPTSSPLDDGAARGNLFTPLSVLHVAGIWPASDFRGPPQLRWATYLLCALAASLAVYGCAVAVRRRAWPALLYVGGALVAALAIGAVGSPWVDGKAMATASPAIPFAAALAAGTIYARGRRVLAAALGGLLAAGVLWSSVSAYGGVSLAPRDQLAELQAVGERIAGHGPTLMTEYQPYGVRHFLREGDAEGASELRYRRIPLLGGALLRKGRWADTDSFQPSALGVYRTLVLRRSPLQSRPPSPYRLTWRGSYYETWRLDPAAAYPIARAGLGSGRGPDARLGCARILGLARQAGPAGSLAAAAPQRPVRAPVASWRWPAAWPAIEGAPIPRGGGRISAPVRIRTGGEYEVWLEGSVRSSVALSIDGRDAGAVRHRLNNEGLYIDLGSAELAPGRHRIALDFGAADLHPGSARTTDPLRDLFLSRTDPAASAITRVRTDRAGRLCGHAWDWVEALPPG